MRNEVRSSTKLGASRASARALSLESCRDISRHAESSGTKGILIGEGSRSPRASAGTAAPGNSLPRLIGPAQSLNSPVQMAVTGIQQLVEQGTSRSIRAAPEWLTRSHLLVVRSTTAGSRLYLVSDSRSCMRSGLRPSDNRWHRCSNASHASSFHPARRLTPSPEEGMGGYALSGRQPPRWRT